MRLVGSLTVAALLPVLYAQDGGAVEGIVVNAVTGVGIGGATVRLTFRQDHYETVTDGAGEFRISGIKPGDYVAIAEKATYSVPPSQALRRAQVHIGSEKEPVRLRFELLPPATLRGRVFGIDGNPAVRAKVDVGGGQVKTTGDDGSFVFEISRRVPIRWLRGRRRARARAGCKMACGRRFCPRTFRPCSTWPLRKRFAFSLGPINPATISGFKRRQYTACEE